MIIVKEKQAVLDEMARVCKKSDGYGIVVELYSRDHGKIGNSRQPAHAHLFDTNMQELGEFELTLSIPKKSVDIAWYRTDPPPTGYADKIVKLANANSKYGINNWQHALKTWEDHHP